MRLDELTPEKRENLSTEEITQIASTLADDERIYCSVDISPVIKLMVYLDNKAEDHGMNTMLQVYSPGHMKSSLIFPLDRSSLQMAQISGRDLSHSGLSPEDIINIFGLGPDVRWHVPGAVVKEGAALTPAATPTPRTALPYYRDLQPRPA
jgi:hypothetical protein